MEEMKTKLNENKKKDFLEENNFKNDFIELNDSIKELNTTDCIDKNQNENGIIKIKAFNIYFYLYLNKDNIFNFKIRTDFFDINNQYVYELIKNVVKIINDKKICVQINSINYIISLKDIEEEENMDFYMKNYELKLCNKKNNFPKEDSPYFSSSSLLNIIENDNISFISKNPLNIMLREKYENYEKNNNKNYQLDENYDII